MPRIIIHKNGERHEGEVAEDVNLVVQAGIRKYPYPHLSYGCGMGKCAKCKSRIVAGAAHLPEPNWKEKKTLGAALEDGYRLICQLRIHHDLEIVQE